MTHTHSAITAEHLAKSLSFDAYMQLVEDLLAEGKSTAPTQDEALTHYSELNLHRMKRVAKTTKLNPEVIAAMADIDAPQAWVVLTEGWCGDAAHFTPLIQAIAIQNPLISLHFLLRDGNLDVMDQYLTNGGRSIPKMVILDANGAEVGTWGPRPQALSTLIQEWKADDSISMDRAKELAQKWYAKDRGKSTMAEITALLG